MDPRVLCGLCLYCNSLMETVDGRKRTSVWTDILSPVYDWLFFRALDGFLLDFVGVRMLLFCKDDIITNRYVCICGRRALCYQDNNLGVYYSTIPAECHWRDGVKETGM